MTPLLSWDLMPQVLFSSSEFKFAQYYTWMMKNIAKHKKLLNIFCIVYMFVLNLDLTTYSVHVIAYNLIYNHRDVSLP